MKPLGFSTTDTMEEFTKEEESLLLMLECACVDYGGAYVPGRTSENDRQTLDRWKAAGFCDHGRIVRAVDIVMKERTCWVRLSPEAMAAAHALRAARAERLWGKRLWRTAGEKGAGED